MNNKRKLLGLDIDGVLNPCRLENKDEPEITRTSVYYLNKIIESVPNCYILITSCWGNRDGRTTTKLCESGFLYPEKIIGHTEFSSNGNFNRTKEVVKWMENQSEYDRIVCLDDEAELFDYIENKYEANRFNSVFVQSDIGLNESKSYEVVCKLQGINFRFWG